MHRPIEDDHYRSYTRSTKFSCKFNETIFENLEAHEKRLSFIFHLFVKYLINISDAMFGHWIETLLNQPAVRVVTLLPSCCSSSSGTSVHGDSSQLDQDRCSEFLWCWLDPQSMDWKKCHMALACSSIWLWQHSSGQNWGCVVANTRTACLFKK